MEKEMSKDREAKMTNKELMEHLDKAVEFHAKLLNTLAGRNITDDDDDLAYLSNTMNIIVDNMDKAVRRRFGVGNRQEEISASSGMRSTNKPAYRRGAYNK